MSAPKSPAELMADLTDQVRLLRQDVVNLTATATTKTEAAKLMASVQRATQDAFERSQQVIDASDHLTRRMHHDSANTAQITAEKAIMGLEDHRIRSAAKLMRLEALRTRREAFYSFGGGFWRSMGVILALGALLGILAFMLIQGRGDARTFGQHPGVFCTSAGGEFADQRDGSRYCVFMVTPPAQQNGG